MAKAETGIIAVDKMGAKVLFLNPKTYATEVVIDGFLRTVHELLVMPETGRAYVPIFGDGIHGRNPNPQHYLCVFDLHKRALIETIDLRPYIAPHTLKLGPDGLIYITCENSAVVAVIDPKINKVVGAIDSGSTNGHRLIIAADGKRLYTENEEDDAEPFPGSVLSTSRVCPEPSMRYASSLWAIMAPAGRTSAAMP